MWPMVMTQLILAVIFITSQSKTNGIITCVARHYCLVLSLHTSVDYSRIYSCLALLLDLNLAVHSHKVLVHRLNMVIRCIYWMISSLCWLPWVKPFSKGEREKDILMNAGRMLSSANTLVHASMSSEASGI